MRTTGRVSAAWNDRVVRVREGFTIEDGPGGLVVVVTGDWSRSAERALHRPEVTGLTLNYALGFRERNLDFIGEWPIRELSILARTIDDLSPVYRLSSSLERLDVQSSPNAAIDLGRLPWLTELGAEWPQIADTIEHAISLVDLFTMAYEPTDLSPLGRNQRLARLRFKHYPRLTSLDGIQLFPGLSELEVYGARRLTDFGALARSNAPHQIKRLTFQSCPGLTDLDALGSQPQLHSLGIAECGDIASLRPLSGMSMLSTLWAWGGTRIVDEDLSPLLDLKALRSIRMMSRRMYHPSIADVKRHLGIKD